MKWLKEALRQILGLYCATREAPKDPRPMREKAAAPPPAQPLLVLVDAGKVRMEASSAGVVCETCKREVTVYRRYADGRIECIPCPGRNGRRR